MRLFFTVPDTPQTQNGVLLRNFLRQCAVSTDLARAVKFRGSGFFYGWRSCPCQPQGVPGADGQL